jgi:hypothetical protein
LVAVLVHRCREIGLWREIIDCVEKYLQTSYRALPFILFLPFVESQLACKTDTVPPSPLMTQSLRPRKAHDRTRPPDSLHSIRSNRRKDMQAGTGRQEKKDAQAQPMRNTYVRKEKAVQVHNRNNREKENVSNNRKRTRGRNKEEMF